MGAGTAATAEPTRILQRVRRIGPTLAAVKLRMILCGEVITVTAVRPSGPERFLPS